MTPRKRKSGSMHLEWGETDAEAMKRPSTRPLRKVLVLDPDPTHCAAIAQCVPRHHAVLLAQEPTLALAVCVRECPALVIAPADLGTITLVELIAYVDYASSGPSPRFIALGWDRSDDHRVVALPGETVDLAALASKIVEVLGEG